MAYTHVFVLVLRVRIPCEVGLFVLSRLLAVTGFSTHKMADFSVPIRFDMFNYAPIYIGAKNPGIRIELLESHKSDKKKTQVHHTKEHFVKLLEIYTFFFRTFLWPFKRIWTERTGITCWWKCKLVGNSHKVCLKL